MRHGRRALLAAAVLLAALAPAARPAPVAAEQEYEMTTYQFALLVDGPRRDALTGEAAERKQAEHVAYLAGLLADGRALVMGPVDDAAPIRGVVVLEVATTAEAEEILAGDPWVLAGHLAAEVHPWWAAKGIMRRGPAATDLEGCWLGLLRRPLDPPRFSEEKSAQLQQGHMDNIGAMAASGDLMIAGPMGDDTSLRGIFVFRTAGRPEVEALVARDPAVQAGRLEMELMRWHVPRGSWPPAAQP